MLVKTLSSSKIDDAIMLLLEISYLFFYVKTALLVLQFLLRINWLSKLNLLSLDLIDMIELTKQSTVDTMITKVSMKKNTSLLERSTYPFLKCIRISKKINMFRLQES